MNLEFDTQNKIENEGRKDKGNDITNNKNRLFHNYFTKFKENGLNKSMAFLNDICFDIKCLLYYKIFVLIFTKISR